MQEKYPDLLEYALRELSESNAPLVRHFNQNGIHLFISKMVGYLLLQFVVDFIGVYFIKSPSYPYLIFVICSLF